MTSPISIRVDLQAKAAYINYSDEAVVDTIDVWEDGQVAADIDMNGKVIGIEVLGFDDETLRQAHAYAEKNGLGFPANLAGVLVAA